MSDSVWTVLAVTIIGMSLAIVAVWARTRRAREMEKIYAHCRCGKILSEWFVKDGRMWCCPYARGCGTVSDWSTHQEYRDGR